ncbi:SMAD/FHA domain-containing protein [Chlamydoabsidia padenii]|nr:SMAD/FHA domain-containing protein [Chlamydoabsidia padenii]
MSWLVKTVKMVILTIFPPRRQQQVTTILISIVIPFFFFFSFSPLLLLLFYSKSIMPSPPRHSQDRTRSSRYRRSSSRSPPPRHSDRHRSRSPRRRPYSPRRQSDRHDSPPRRPRQDRNKDNNKSRPEQRQKYTWGGRRSPSPEKEEEQVEPEGPNYGLSGKLAAETNTVNGVELKYNEPGEAAKPKQHWRLYVFKGSEQIDLLHVHRQSAFLIGRDRVVVDIPVDHPSCSKQHAVLQYRRVNDDQGQSVVKPFIIDLEATNGTFINGEKIPPSRYVELKMKDVVTFGQSTREYVLLHSE